MTGSSTWLINLSFGEISTGVRGGSVGSGLSGGSDTSGGTTAKEILHKKHKLTFFYQVLLNYNKIWYNATHILESSCALLAKLNFLAESNISFFFYLRIS